MSYERSEIKCGNCGEDTIQDSVDIGIGIIYGPRGCPVCGWSEDPEYDLSKGQSNIRPDGSVFDPYGRVWPAGSVEAKSIVKAKNEEGKD